MPVQKRTCSLIQTCLGYARTLQSTPPENLYSTNTQAGPSATKHDSSPAAHNQQLKIGPPTGSTRRNVAVERLDRSAIETIRSATEGGDVSLAWPLTRRVAFAVIAAYLVVSVVFAFVAVAPTTNTGWIKYVNEGSDDTAEKVQAYREARNLDEPLLDRYASWLVDVTTLDWGQAYGGVGPGTPGTGYEAGTPVTSLVGSALYYTLWYVIPAMVIAVVGGIGIGLYTATHQHTLLDRLGTSATYLGFSIPNFWIAQMLVLFVLRGSLLVDLGLSGRAYEVLQLVVFPTLVLATSLLAGQMRYARAQSLEYLNSEFIKLVRAKGAGGWDVARHLLRNAALPLFSLFFTEMLGLVVLNIFVIEYVFGIPGLGGVSLFPYQEQDLPVILGTTMVIVIFGVLGNLLQDIAYLVLDPRVEE